MKDGHPFVGRKAELKQFSELLEDSAGKAILVSGSASMGKSMLLRKMAQSAQTHPTLKCTCLDYQITPSDGVDSTMLEIVNDAADAVQSLSGKLRSTANANKEKLSALFSVAGAIPMVGQSLEKLGNLLLSLAEQARQGNARQQLKQMLRLLSEKLPENGRMLFFIDPEKLMPDGSADAWRLVIKELPDKILVVFAQRPEEVLISDAYFTKLDNVHRVPKDTLEVFLPEDIETLIESRRSEFPSGIGEKEIRACLNRYQGHPFSIQAALDLLIEGVTAEELPSRAEPVEFAYIIIQTIERKGNTEALSFLEAAAIIEVPATKEMITHVAGLSEKQARIILADRFVGGLFRQEAKGLRIYHIILADEILKGIDEKDKKEYHGRTAQVYRQMLRKAREKQTCPDEIAIQVLPKHVLESEGVRAFVNCFINECTPFLLRLGFFDLLILFSENALSIVEQGTESQATLLGNLGVVYQTRGQLEKAEEMHIKALEISRQLGQLKVMAGAYCNIGNIYQIRGQLDKAEDMFNNAIEINKQLDNMEVIASQYGNLGNVFQARGQLTQAEEMYNKSIEINKQLGLLEGMARQYGSLGNVYLLRGKMNNAKEMYSKSLEINKQLGQLEGMASDYSGLGIVYQIQGQLDKAEEMHSKAFVIEDQLGRLQGMAVVYGNLGNVSRIRGQLDKAEAMYRKSLEINEQLGYHEGMAHDYFNMGNVYVELWQMNIAIEFWQKAKRSYEQLGKMDAAEEIQRGIEGLEKREKGKDE
jgi:tetratricopeptide (TPR) repeat protein